uniref:Uncharacterized protein n=1 Tax=Setaria italica TaxID=4555 RepID=K3ZLN0_SETIT
ATVLLISLLAAALATCSSYPGLRHRTAIIRSTASLAAGAVKEALDKAGLFGSASALPKDVAADLVGVAAATLILALVHRRRRERKAREDSDARIPDNVSMV